MNKGFFGLIITIGLAFIFISCSSTSGKSAVEQGSTAEHNIDTDIENEAIPGVEKLANAIQLIGSQMENDLKQGSVVAVVSFDSPSEAFSNYVIGELNNLFLKNKKLIVAEQQKLDLVRENEQYQLSGAVSDETAVRIGHSVGAQFIISGYLIDLGTAYRFGIYAINMQDRVRVSQPSTYLSGYDEQVAFLVTGSNQRPSEKIIPPQLTRASSKAGFMQAASIMIGNSFINKIPRNSVIAITIPGGFVFGDYVRNELEYILNNSNRFQIVPFRDIDAMLSVRVQDMVTSYEGEDGVVTDEVITRVFTDKNELQNIGKNLNANIVFNTVLWEYETKDSDGSVIAACQVAIEVLYTNTLERISTVSASWGWPSDKEEFFEE